MKFDGNVREKSSIERLLEVDVHPAKGLHVETIRPIEDLDSYPALLPGTQFRGIEVYYVRLHACTLERLERKLQLS
jgi:hypothetical protein